MKRCTVFCRYETNISPRELHLVWAIRHRIWRQPLVRELLFQLPAPNSVVLRIQQLWITPVKYCIEIPSHVAVHSQGLLLRFATKRKPYSESSSCFFKVRFWVFFFESVWGPEDHFPFFHDTMAEASYMGAPCTMRSRLSLVYAFRRLQADSIANL